MKINSVNSFNYNSNKINFKRTAVPYPEYMNGYYKLNQPTFENQVTNVISKVTSMFTPEVSDESKKIKSSIDGLYANKVKSEPVDFNAHLLSVLA